MGLGKTIQVCWAPLFCLCLASSFDPMKRRLLLFWIGELLIHLVGFEAMTFLSNHYCKRRRKENGATQGYVVF